MKIENIITDGQITSAQNFSQFERILAEISVSDDALRANYTKRAMDLENHVSYDMLLDGDQVVCMSGMYHRPSWPEGVFRTSNRTWVNPEYRQNTYSFNNPRLIGPHQIERFQDRIRTVFISREHPKARGYFRALQKRVPYYSDWQISDHMMQVVPGCERRACYQYIIYKTQDDISHMGFVTEQEWFELT